MYKENIREVNCCDNCKFKHFNGFNKMLFCNFDNEYMNSPSKTSNDHDEFLRLVKRNERFLIEPSNICDNYKKEK